MRADQIRQRMWLGATGMFFLSLVVAVADRTGLLNPFRPMIHDALSPGRLIVVAMTAREKMSPQADVSSGKALHDEQQKKNELLLRQLMIENARLRRDLKREKMASSLVQMIEPLSSLAQFRLIEASVVSTGGMPNSLRELIVDAGKSAGITRSELVIAGNGIMVDAGTDHSVNSGDRVLTGAVVVGRIDKAARWVSLVQPVNAAGFKAQVTLLRRTPDGLHFGVTGTLEGTGEEECSVTGIPHTEAVAVGDEVISADVNGVKGPQLYFGRVTRAEFLAGGQWDVRVQPAASLNDLESVGILRLGLERAIAEKDQKPASERRRTP